MRKCLVISFGGLTGLNFLGKLHTLDLSNVTHYYGTSVGAILSALLAINMKPFDIFTEFCKLDRFCKIDLKKFLFSDVLAVGSSLPAQHAICHLFQKYYGSIPTFGELAAKNRHVFMYAGENNNLIEFSAARTPNISLFDGLMASSAIPILFDPYKIGDRQFIDGAFFNPLPVGNALEKFQPGELIVLHAREWKSEDFDNPKIGLVMNLLGLAVNNALKESLNKLTCEMEVYAFSGPRTLVTTQPSLKDMWTYFLSGHDHQ